MNAKEEKKRELFEKLQPIKARLDELLVMKPYNPNEPIPYSTQEEIEEALKLVEQEKQILQELHYLATGR